MRITELFTAKSIALDVGSVAGAVILSLLKKTRAEA